LDLDVESGVDFRISSAEIENRSKRVLEIKRRKGWLRL